MNLGDDIKAFLPKYLSEERVEDLFRELKQFPGNIDGRLYSSTQTEELLQGDVIDQLPIVLLPEERIELRSSLIVSNTCDISTENRRYVPAGAVYAPIIRLDKWKTLIENSRHIEGKPLTDYLRSIREQRVSSIFYLPTGQGIEHESLVLLDHLCNCSANHVVRKAKEGKGRIASLSNYGFYLLLFKLSMHFCRIQEGTQRS
ncbi:MAG: hypothetical protein HYV27_23175 [Candidatus Hydrogenedentes bacterium]|nr:hypothetical protein [Candidatus Hydrogenedentota bacterium]